MSSALTLARPYARAAFELAHSHKALPLWAEQLAFAAEVASDPRAAALFGNPRISPAELASLFLPHGEKADSEFGRFIALLIENGRLPVLPEIRTLFEELKLESERLLKVLDLTMGIRASEDDELTGLDVSQHAETAYNLAESTMAR